ncbi:MAG: M48 family metallopeptidase [Candidatus Thioglobus autotrophicus]|nr:M48 family metallopeptidase [Candidatus Thioglobus autotrophicus]
MEFNFFTFIFLFAILTSVIALLWLNFRQDRAIKISFNEVPEGFKETITLEDHQKAGRYTQAKLLANHFEIIFSTIVLLIWTLGGAMNWLDVFWHEKISDPIWLGTVFILSIMLIASFIDLPFSIYRNFILEERFGFNRMTIKTFTSDLIKELILTLALGMPLIYAILYLMNMSAIGDYWWIYVWAILSLFTIIMMWIYPTFIAPIFNKFKPLENNSLRNRIDSLLERTGFGSDGIFIMDGSKRSSHGNAYFTGIGRNKRIVFFDTLLKGMEDEEIEAILAHELGHFHHKHVRQRIVSSFIFSLTSLALLGYLIKQGWFFHGLGISEPSSHTALVLFSLTLPVFSFFITPISNLISRKHEFQADAFAASHTDANDLISSLTKLYRENSSTLSPDKYYSAFHDSHPSAILRIARLQ